MENYLKKSKNELKLKDKIILGTIVIYSWIHILNRMSWNGNIIDKTLAFMTMPWSLI